MEINWEEAGDLMDTDKHKPIWETWTAEVPGGFIVRHIDYDDKGRMSCTMCYVPCEEGCYESSR